MLCSTCGIREAREHYSLGYLPCKSCSKKAFVRPQKGVEFTSDAIKEQRKENWADIHGAHREGVPSAEYRDRWGADAMKQQGFSDEEIKKAKPVWDDDKPYKG